ncbi:MAG TPA: MBL fold metallo-hydrolase, partial [Polyangia bacterium]|nr:MBL fold metallo-hydrolase [Polyangia bacterium]
VNGGPIATRELLLDQYARPRDWYWEYEAHKGDRKVFAIAPNVLPLMGRLLSAAARAKDFGSFADAVSDEVTDDIAEMLAPGFVDSPENGVWSAVSAAGVYRREHASLIIRSESGATIVTDPQLSAFGWTTNFGRRPEGPNDVALGPAILLTHGHNDHWDLASILHWASEQPIIVPRVPRPSLLTDVDHRAVLESLDLAVLAPAWDSTIRIGDVEVDILPFYGEQPTRSLPLPHPDVRNWGNCYRFNLPGWSLALLVDSGVDAAGSMHDALRRSVEKRGPIDVIMSCCMEFREGDNPGLPHYLLTVPFEHVGRVVREASSTTLGPLGLAEVCEIARARYFMPYAHGFNGIGMDPRSTEGHQTEARALDRLREQLTARRVATQVVAWSPGDFMSFDHGKVVVRRYSRSE